MLQFALTIFVSAFLLFQVQPLIGRFILPWFGGGPSIWTGCMLFFQIVLLGGYSYAHLLCARLSARAQVRTHLAVLALSVLLLPIAPNDSWKPVDDQSPLLRIFLLLLVTVGGPYFVLASTGPLMQKWFSQTAPGKSPYRLYALSNIGSLLALLSYPFVFEPWLTLQHQVVGWSVTYVVFAVLAAGCAVRLARTQRTSPSHVSVSDNAAPADNTAEANTAEANTDLTNTDLTNTDLTNTGLTNTASDVSEANQASHRPSVGLMLLWLSLAASGSAMLLATTNQLCIDVATVPFLWVLPLSMYLVSFIICFDRPQWYDRRAYGVLLLVCAPLAAWAIAHGADVDLPRQVLIFSAALFACCMTCHGELVQSRPHPQHLTLFYLLISAGGVLGGIFVAVVAPLIFSGYWEFHVSLVACCVLTLAAWCARGVWRTPPSDVFWTWFGSGLATCAMVIGMVWLPSSSSMTGTEEVILLGGMGCLLLAGMVAIGRLDQQAKLPLVWLMWGLLPMAWVVGVGHYRLPEVMNEPLSAWLENTPLSAWLEKSRLSAWLMDTQLIAWLMDTRLSVWLIVSALAASAGSLAALWLLRRLNSTWQSILVRLLCAVYAGLVAWAAWHQEILMKEHCVALALTVAGGLLMDWALSGTTWPRLPVPGVWCWATAIGLIFALANQMTKIVHTEIEDVVFMTRNFYGVLQVEFEPEREMPSRYRLMHGQIQHGFQYDDDYWGRQPTTYYGPDSGLSLAIHQVRSQRRTDDDIHVGIVGLGTGTIATYGEAGDRFRFYEINPQVQDLSGRFFTYLQDSAAQTQIVLGDARIVMEREVAAGNSQQLDVLAIDAFSSDAIPVHLLTAECGEIYRQQIREGGILAIHISNRFLDLGPVVRGLAEHLKWQTVRIANDEDESTGVFSSTWVLLTEDADLARTLEDSPNHDPWLRDERVLLWTDDYSGLWPILTL